MHRPGVWLIVSLCALAGCFPHSFETAEDQFRLTDRMTASDFFGGFRNGGPVLAGTTLCVEPEWIEEEPLLLHDDLFFDCFEHHVEGPATLEEEAWYYDQCISLDGPGEVTWWLIPGECDVVFEEYELVTDHVRFEVVAHAATRGRIAQWADEYAMDYGYTTDAGGFPLDLLNPEGEPFRVVEGQEVVFFLQIEEQDGGRVVAWSRRDGEVTAAAAAGGFEAETIDNQPGWIGLNLEPASAVQLGLLINGTAFEGGSVVSLPGTEAVSLDLGIVYLGDETYRSPAAARAVLRDAQGRAIYGAPVTWEVSGNEHLYALPGPQPGTGELHGMIPVLPGADYAELVVDHLGAPDDYYCTEQTATVTASYGDLSDTVELVWTSQEEPEPEPETQAPPDEDPPAYGCDCSASPPPPGGAAWLATATIFLWTRRLLQR